MRSLPVPLAVALAASFAPALLAGGKGGHDASAAKAGARLYRTHCATCHGPGGKGDGPMVERLRVVPPDLTGVSRRNGGKFPFEMVYRIIDGREVVEGHGGSGMPIWGDAFLEEKEGYSAEKVKERITQLTSYLASIQSE